MSSNPIPLSSLAGTIYAYACPTCHHVGETWTRWSDADGPEPSTVSWSLREATDCCVCRTCGLVERSLLLNCRSCAEQQTEQWEATEAARQAAEDAAEAVREAALAQALDRDAASCLLDRMAEYSEDYYAAGWLIDLEFTIWKAIQGPNPSRWNRTTRQLSDQCGGWWSYVAEIGPCFVPIEEWLATFAAHSAAQEDR